MVVRKGEVERNWFRTDRFERINGQLYFQTREGDVEGPFSDMNEAQMELMLYLRHSDDVLYQNAG